MIVIDEGDLDAGTTTRSFWRSCKIRGFTDFDGIVETAPNGFQSITDSYFEKLNTCMAMIADSIPPR